MARIDQPRLAATLGQAALARVVAALRRRLELGRALEGMLVLGEATPEERAACDALLGRRPTRGTTLTLDLDALAARLAAAGISENLTEAVEALAGPVVNRVAVAARHAAAWDAVWQEAEALFAAHSLLASWPGELRRSGVLKRLVDDSPEAGAAVLRAVARVTAA
ncbi:MAG: TIGR02679 domain-containing protein, partial [Burkholderiales bacterium]